MQVKVSGIEYMNDDPAMVDVLYAKVEMKDGSERLVLLSLAWSPMLLPEYETHTQVRLHRE